MHISFEDIHQELATFRAGDGAAEGAVCKVSANETVAACGAGEAFCGVVSHVREGAAAVVTGGFVTLPYTGSAPVVGYGKLAADGSGGVTVSDSGREHLIVSVDETASVVGLFL